MLKPSSPSPSFQPPEDALQSPSEATKIQLQLHAEILTLDAIHHPGNGKNKHHHTTVEVEISLNVEKMHPFQFFGLKTNILEL
jgi:hypothetical protein